MTSRQQSKSSFIHPSFYGPGKRIIDSVLALLAICLLSPFIILGWLLLYLQHGLPIIFRQERLGYKQQRFILYKLRTMVNNAESLKKQNQNYYQQLNIAPQPMFKIKDDPRFTKAGRGLSSAGLDELPQLINVIRGDMALVGPRPLPSAEALALKQIDPQWFEWRHQIKPGIFSVWTYSDQRHHSLKSWKKLERQTLTLNLWQQYLLMIKVIVKQIKYAIQL